MWKSSSSIVFLLLCAVVPWQMPVAAQVLTAQMDNSRRGANVHETVLTPANVNSDHFGKLYSRTVDGDIFAQPLYARSLNIRGVGKRNVVFVATEHDSVYAFDASGASDAPLWKTSFIGTPRGISTVAAQDVHCPFIIPEVGITSTPVIDPSSRTIYVLARTNENGKYVQRLHALDISSGQEKPNSPVVIEALVKGTGKGSVDGKVSFDPLRENPRSALLLTGGQIYLTWGSSCDVGPYHGWIMAYDAHTLKQTAVINTSPDGGEGGIWQSDAGPAADDDGNVFVVTGNGDFNAAGPGGRDYGDSVLKLHLEKSGLAVRDYFTPFNQKLLDSKDWDLGSQGPLLLPKQQGNHAHLLVVAGKEGKLYVLDRDRLGRYRDASDSQIVQSIKLPAGYGAVAYWNGHIFYADCCGFVTHDFVMKNGLLKAGPVTGRMSSLGGIPSVSADGAANGILWVVSTKEWNEFLNDKPAVLHAYEAANIAHELYNSEQVAGRDRAGMTVRFATPTIADGHVFVGARRQLDVYGLLRREKQNPK